MTFSVRPAAIAIACAALVSAAIVTAAELQEDTGRAYSTYAEQATRAFLEHIRGIKPATDGSSPPAATTPRSGEVMARPAREDGIISVPGGLVHHWAGSTFIAGVTLKDALDVSSRYNDYPAVYKPIVASTLLGHEGNSYRVLMRISESAGGFSAVLDVTSRVEYFHPDNRSVYSISTSEEIRELRDPGTAKERKLSPGRDSGYLWRAAAFTHMVERDGGVFVEMETIGLSRGFPMLLGWIIEPVARRIGRSSVERSLQEFSKAVRTRAQAQVYFSPASRPGYTRLPPHAFEFARHREARE
jgi:hypothetical protein